MPLATPFSGVLTAVATPFTRTGEIDVPAFERILALLKNAGTHGVVVAGTTGESPTLTEEEKTLLVRTALAHRTEAFRIYVGTGSNDTRATIESSLRYGSMESSAGQAKGQTVSKVDGVMVVVPYYNRPTQKGLFEHFGAVAKAVGPIPVCVYNVPGRTGSTLAVPTAVGLFEAHANIVAIKEAAGNVGVVTELARALAPLRAIRDVQILSGDDATFAPAMLCGATGVISVTTHVVPGAMLALWKAARENDFLGVAKLHAALHPINVDFFCEPNPIPLKWALARLGVCENILRLPLTPLDEGGESRVGAALDSAKASGVALLA